MADKTLYAWSRFPVGQDDSGKTKWIEVGDKVSGPGDLGPGTTQEEFDDLVAGGSIRARPYPLDEMKEAGHSGSPSEFYKAQMAAMAEGDYLAVQGEVMPADEAPGASGAAEVKKEGGK